MTRILLLLVAVGLAIPTSRPRAQNESASAAKLALARSLFGEAIDAVKKSDWETAHTKFRRSYKLAPRVTTLLNLAGAQFETGRYLEASESFKRYIREARESRYDIQRKGAQGRLATIEKRLARARIEIRGLRGGDEIVIDGVSFPVTALDRPLPFNPGVHTVLVRDANGKDLAKNQFSLTSGSTRSVVVRVPRRTPTVSKKPKDPGPVGGKKAPALNKGSSKRVVIVVNPRSGVKTLGRAELRNIFLGKKAYWKNGQSVRPFRRSLASKAGKMFLSTVLGMRQEAFTLYWDERQLSGGGLPPRKVGSAKKILDAVRASPGGIGFLLESELPSKTSGLRVIRL